MIFALSSLQPLCLAVAAPALSLIELRLHMTLVRTSVRVSDDGQFWPNTKPVNACLMNSFAMIDAPFEVIDWNDSCVRVKVLSERRMGGSSHGMGVKAGEILTLPRRWVTTEYFTAG